MTTAVPTRPGVFVDELLSGTSATNVLQCDTGRTLVIRSASVSNNHSSAVDVTITGA